MPETVAAISAAAQAVSGFLATTYGGISVGTYLTLAAAVYGSVQQRRSARKMASAARDAYNASLTDRTVSVSAADNPWQIIYGKATVGASFVAVLTSGARDEYKHLIAVWAAHECTGIDDFKLNGTSVGPLDASGYVQAGSRWFKTEGVLVTEPHAVASSGGTVTLDHPADRLHAVAYTTGSGQDQVTYLIEDLSTVTISGSTITLPAPYATEWATFTVNVTYEWTRDVPLLRVRHFLGSDSQTASSELMALLPTEWTSSDRGRGLCYSWIEYNLNEPEFQGGPVQPTATIRGKKVYDPRLDSTQPGGSGAHRRDDPSTWAYSTNNALCTADFIRAKYGKQAPTAMMGWPSVMSTATVCDTSSVYTLSGGGTVTQPLYTCNGSFRTDQDPDVTLDQLCQSMAGFATFMGSWTLQAGAWTAPVMTLTDADNMGPVEVMPASTLEETFNGLRGRFYDPTRFDQVTDYTPYQNAGFVTADGEEWWENLDLPFTDSAIRAHQLCRIQVERSRGMALVYPAKLRALKLKPGQRIVLTCSVLGITAVSFRVVKREWQPGSAVKLALIQDTPGHYDLVDAPAPITTPSFSRVDPFIVEPVGNLAANRGGEALVRDPDGNVISRVLLSYDAAADELVRSGGRLEVEQRLHTVSTWTRQPDAPGDSTSTPMRGLQENRLYVVRARWVNSLGIPGPWRSTVVLTDTVVRSISGFYSGTLAGPWTYSTIT